MKSSALIVLSLASIPISCIKTLLAVSSLAESIIIHNNPIRQQLELLKNLCATTDSGCLRFWNLTEVD